MSRFGRRKKGIGGGSGKKGKKANPEPVAENSVQKASLPVQQDGKEVTPFLEASLSELKGGDAFSPSNAEMDLMEARQEGNDTDLMQQGGYFGGYERFLKMSGAVKEAEKAKNMSKAKARDGRGTEEDAEANKNRADRAKAGKEGLKGSLADDRTEFLSRKTDQRNAGLESEGVLGAGQVGEVHKAKRSDGSKGVFKKEGQMPGEAEKTGVNLEHGMNASREVASSMMDDMLGSGVITKTEFAEMGGEHGSIMDYAEGEHVYEAKDVAEGQYDDEVLYKGMELGVIDKVGELGKEQLQESFAGDVDFSDPVIQQKLIELQIQDSLSAQIDRHALNYKIEYGEDGESAKGVTGFDNDASFGRDATDWQKASDAEGFDALASAVGLPPIIDRDQYDRIMALDPVEVNLSVGSVLPTEEADAAMIRVWNLQDHAEELMRSGRVVDGWDEKSFEALLADGGGHSYVARDHLFQEGLKQRNDEFAEFKAKYAEAKQLEEEAKALDAGKIDNVDIDAVDNADLAEVESEGDGGGKEKKPKKKRRSLFSRLKKSKRGGKDKK